MIKKYYTLLSFVFYLHITASELPYQAIVVVPVADLVGQPILNSQHQGVYHLPISGVGSNGCSRVHQVIFNERVTVLEERGDEIRVRLQNIFFEQANNTTRFTEYWTHKHAVLALDASTAQNIPLTLFPEPIDFEKQVQSQQKIITLMLPHYDKLTQQTYSAGTRFVVSSTKQNKVIVFTYSPKHQKVCKISLPQHICLKDEPRTPQDKITLFTSLVQQWAHQQHGFIPYVLGGCSFTTTCRTNHFIKKNNAYYRPTYPNAPAPGLDCTGIIARATQICGIPYYFKNTTTVVKYLRTLKKQETVENGDIIWFAGHAIIIADVANNLCVEARSYDHGFGKIHAITVDKLFADMYNLEDIKTAMLNNKSITRLDSAGNKVQIIPSIKILKLSSVWDHQQETHKA